MVINRIFKNLLSDLETEGDKMKCKIGDLVKHKLNEGAWLGIITKHRLLKVHGHKYYVEWTAGGRGWYYIGDLKEAV